jgi:hypothetical protein
MLHHPIVKALGVGAVLGVGAWAVKTFHHGTGTPPVTPHGSVVTTGGAVISPAPSTSSSSSGGPNPTVNTGDVAAETVDTAASTSDANALLTSQDAIASDAATSVANELLAIPSDVVASGTADAILSAA